MTNFNLLLNDAGNATGPAIFLPVAGKAVSLTLTGNPGGGTVIVEAHDAYFETWTDVPALTLNATTLTASAVVPVTADALRARLVGATNADCSVTGTV
jgi:hypothetical protein